MPQEWLLEIACSMSDVGLGCLPGRRPTESERRGASLVLASEGMVQLVTMAQPPADLLISITSGIRKIVEAAVNRRP
jgi:hypothetical protein